MIPKPLSAVVWIGLFLLAGVSAVRGQAGPTAWWPSTPRLRATNCRGWNCKCAGPYPDFGPFFGRIFSVGEPRRIQMALKLNL